jgi:thiosulfate dehydrogenase
MGRFLLGFLIGIVVVPLAVYVYLRMGAAPVATSAPPMPFEKTLANTALDARLDSIPEQPVPFLVTDTTLASGAKEYREHCAMCHGLPTQGQPQVAKNMFPKPPALFHGKGVTDDPPSRTFWVVKHGIRLSGMPAFDGVLDDQRIWEIAGLLAKAQQLPASVQQQLEQPPVETARR